MIADQASRSFLGAAVVTCDWDARRTGRGGACDFCGAGEDARALEFGRFLATAERSNRIAQAAVAEAMAPWANLFSRCAAIHASTSGLTLVPRRK